MTKIILAAMLAFGFSAFAADTHGTTTTTTTTTEGAMPAEGTGDAAATTGEHAAKDAKGAKMGKKAAKAEKKEKKEHAH